MDNCIFCRIVEGKIPTEFKYQSDDILVFPDVNPQAETHLLIIPRKHICEFAALQPEDKKIWDEMINQARILIEKNGFGEKGYRLVVNGGGAALIDHLHLHLMGGVTVERTLDK